MLTFGNFPEQRSRKRCFLPTVEMKDYNGIVDGRNSFDKPIKNQQRAYDRFWKITNIQGNGHTTGCLLFYHLKNFRNII